MKRKLFFGLTVAAIFTVSLSHGVSAQNVELQYEAIGQTFQYKNEVSVLNVTDTDKMHVSSSVNATLLLENRIQKVADILELHMDFTNIDVKSYRRELQVLNNEKRSVGPDDLTGMNKELKEQVLSQWVQLEFLENGTILKKNFSPNLEKVTLLNLTRIAEQFLIPFPKGEIQIGFQWEDDYHAPLALATQEDLMGTRVKYTYLGTETLNGISCYKFNASLALQEERSLPKEGGGISWISYTGHGTLYYAVTGGYLVKSNLINDLSFLMIVDGAGEQFVNFMRTRIDQNIDLVKTIRQNAAEGQ